MLDYQINNKRSILAFILIGLVTFCSSTLIPLEGNVQIGFYYVTAFVGNPPQELYLIVDTGSHMTIFPCKGGIHCGKHEHELFDPEKSSTFKKIDNSSSYKEWVCKTFRENKEKCNFGISYGEGSSYSGKLLILRLSCK
jgi:hypothetical protein